MLWGKTNKIREELDLFADICQEGVAEFVKAMHYLLEKGHDEQFFYAYEQVKQKEELADQQVFLITQQLYSDFLLPDSREDLARLVHQGDSIMDAAQHVLKLAVTRHIHLSEDLGEFLFELLSTTQECVDKTVEALKLIMGPREAAELKHLVQEIGNLETLCDTVQEKMVTDIFKKHSTVETLLQAELIDAIGAISDACETTAVTMSIMNVKRIA